MRKPKRFEIRYTVRGSGSFPEDMLRYDRSKPATPEDVEWMKGYAERELMLKMEHEGPRTHIKRLIACSSVSHLGFVVLGMFALTQAGVRGSVLQMVNHGLSTRGLR